MSLAYTKLVQVYTAYSSIFIAILRFLFLTLLKGIGTLPPNITSIGNYLEPIIEWATSIIPKDKHSSTPIYFQVTEIQKI
jgi:hypothetical protein